MPIVWCLADPKIGEREVAAELLGHARDLATLPCNVVVIGDKGFAGKDFAREMAELKITFVRPDRRNETRRHGNLALIRQRIESIINTAKSQLSLERHGGRTPAGSWLVSHNASSRWRPRSGTTGPLMPQSSGP